MLQNCFPVGQSPTCISAWGIPAQEQDLAFPFVKFHEIPASLLLLVEVPLYDSTLPSFVCEDILGDRMERRAKI